MGTERDDCRGTKWEAESNAECAGQTHDKPQETKRQAGRRRRRRRDDGGNKKGRIRMSTGRMDDRGWRCMCVSGGEGGEGRDG